MPQSCGWYAECWPSLARHTCEPHSCFGVGPIFVLFPLPRAVLSPSLEEIPKWPHAVRQGCSEHRVPWLWARLELGLPLLLLLFPCFFFFLLLRTIKGICGRCCLVAALVHKDAKFAWAQPNTSHPRCTSPCQKKTCFLDVFSPT